jgi:hypothetical protein
MERNHNDMKTSDGFVKTTIAGIPYLLPYGQKIADHARSLRLNDSGALLWDTLSLGADKSTLLSVLANYYNTDADMLPQLTSDLDSYLASLKQLGMLSYNAPAECIVPSFSRTDFFPLPGSTTSICAQKITGSPSNSPSRTAKIFPVSPP